MEIKSKKIKAAIFDMDGTLIDSLKIWGVIWAKLGEKYLGDSGFVPREEDDKKVRTLTLKDAMALIHRNYGLGASGGDLLDDANRIMADFYTNEVELKAGARDFLEECRLNRVKMCIASATAPDLIGLAMKHCGIEHYFSKVFSCGTIGKGKEHPDVFLMAIADLGEALSETWLFEDSLVAIETAVKIGMPTVGIYDRFNFGQDRIREIATEYIGEGETLVKLTETADVYNETIRLLSSEEEAEVPVSVTYKENAVDREVTVKLKYREKEYISRGKEPEWTDAFADLQKQLPGDMRIKCCLTCRHGTLCPYGRIPNYVLCSGTETIKDKDDVIEWLYRVGDDIERMERSALQSCEHFIFADEAHFTYNDFEYYLRHGAK
ncbi:MAG: HAD family phosphatase [Clostridia bacterium]|nr:HAD family phosphatase [Clostridia bacterium]